MKYYSPDVKENQKSGDNQSSIPSQDAGSKERIRKHMSDINSVITEEDIRNVKTDESITSSQEDKETDAAAKLKADQLLDKERKEEEKEEGEGSNSPEIDNTAWNVLNK